MDIEMVWLNDLNKYILLIFDIFFVDLQSSNLKQPFLETILFLSCFTSIYLYWTKFLWHCMLDKLITPTNMLQNGIFSITHLGRIDKNKVKL